jgi:peptidylprolyl isomerase
MQIAQQGDRVLIHYEQRLQDGSVRSSRGRNPVEVTVGIDPPRLPGLGLRLAGLTPGQETKFTVPPEEAYGLVDPNRIHRWHRKRFPASETLKVGKLARFSDTHGRSRPVRILKLTASGVLVDTNHPFAGQSMDVTVRLISIANPHENCGAPHTATEIASSAKSGLGVANRVRKALGVDIIRQVTAFDVDAESLFHLQKAFPHWHIKRFDDTAMSSLVRNWQPGSADLLVVGVGKSVTEALGLCRFLSFCTTYSEDSRQEFTNAERETETGEGAARQDAPVLVLVPEGEESLVGAALEAGAHSCLMLPIHYKEVRRMLLRSREENQPGRHTLNLQHPQKEDRWRDEGGEG